ncbi:MAG TPA: NYN domain-containing protein [Candidatus Limnocylindrales bacterium]
MTTPAAPAPRRVVVYIDGYNLYYGSLKSTPYKWLDPYALACALLPGDSIEAVHYFTARVAATPGNPGVAQRQDVYLRALATLPRVHVREGFYLLKQDRLIKVQPLNPANPKIPNPANHTVEVWRNEEKGSDVNIATQLLLDAFDGNFDLAVVISNDSDLAWPILKVRQKFGRPVGVFKPERPASYPSARPRPDSQVLKKSARWFRRIEERHLVASQLPATMTDARGTIAKPGGW